MKLKIFSVYDSKALAYGVPFFMPSVGSAVRAFSDLANDPQSMVNRHPTDYVLYEVGEFDDTVGGVVSVQPFVNLGNGGNFIQVMPSQVLKDDSILAKLAKESKEVVQ